jgi:hypothetical protein
MFLILEFGPLTHLAANAIQTGWKYRKGFLAFGAARRIYNMAPLRFKRSRRMSMPAFRKFGKRRRMGVGPRRMNRMRVRSGRGVTTQFDRNTQYVKKSMPRYKKRKWISFVKKVNAVTTSKLGTRTVVFNDSIGVVIPNTAQQIVSCSLYGFDGAIDSGTNCGSRDVLTIAVNEPTITKNGTPAINPINGKITFKSAVLDMTISNNPAETNGPLEVDVYEIFHRKFVKNNTLSGSFAEANANTETISGAGTGLDITNRGVTPFDLPTALSQDGLRIAKKTKYRIPVNGTVTYQIRDSRNILFNADSLNGQDGYAWPGKTRSILLVCKNTVGFNQAGNSVAVGVTRKYSYVTESTNLTKDQLL